MRERGRQVFFVGVDWSEHHHDVCVLDADGRVLDTARVPDGIEGMARLHEILANHADEPDEVIIGIETDRGLLVGALVAAGYEVFAINPLSVDRYRDRHRTSGAKSDPGDAKVLADLVRTDRANHRPVAGDSELAEGLKLLARTHQSFVWERQRHVNRLRSALRESYPAALEAFGTDLASADAVAVLSMAPTPELGRRLPRSKIAAALRRAGRKRNVEARTIQIQIGLRSSSCAPPRAWSAPTGSSPRRSSDWSRGSTRRSRGSSATCTGLLSNTRTPRSSSACQDSDPPSAPGCSASSAMTGPAMSMLGHGATTREPLRSRRPQALIGWCSPASLAISAWPTRVTAGRSRASPPHRALAPSTTHSGSEARRTIRP